MGSSKSAVYSQSFFLSAGETNAEQEMSLPLLTSKIIDIATAHANSLGIGNPAMEQFECGWVLSRIAIRVNRFPMVNETYTLTTWVESWNRHFSIRNFKISDADGKALGYATSVWMILNLKTRENFGLSHLELDSSMIDGSKCPIAGVRKHLSIIPEDAAADGAAELPKGVIRATAPAAEYTFKYCDLDFYRHVNTVRYVSMLLNQFTLAEMDETRVCGMELSFLRESHYGESVSLLRHDEGLHTSFALSDAVDGTSLLFAVVEREPRNLS